ncbi:MAG: hypothetical protein WAW37_19050 [Syntrophobacteraceae bacterium]
MNKKFYSNLTVFAVAFALVLGLGTFNAAKAVPGMGDEGYSNLIPGEVNLFGIDAADNAARVSHRDADVRAYVFTPDSYGLWGTSQQ